MNRPGRKSSRRIELSDEEREKLLSITQRHKSLQRDVYRASLILQLEQDSCVTAAAAAVGVDRTTAVRWRNRFLDCGRLDSLKDKQRSGRPLEISAQIRCEITAMACGKPKDFGVVGRELWTISSLHERFLELHPNERKLSRTSVLRILNEKQLRPHRVKMWLHSPDPEFREKVNEICKLYLNPSPDSLVLCVDEKTGMQALGRKHPGRAPDTGRDRRMDYEYVRNGTRKLMAAFDPHSGDVYSEIGPSRTADDLVSFMESLADVFPHDEIHIIWDNLNTHHDGPTQRWTKFNKRHNGRFHFHYTPIHASWVNQVELFFGILQSRVLRHGVFNTLEELDDSVVAFIDNWNKYERHPFRWKFKGYKGKAKATPSL